MLNRCYVCNVVGHIASECPVNNANMLSNAFDWWDGRFCFLCGYRGHIYFNCPANIFLNLGIELHDCYICGERGSHEKRNCLYKHLYDAARPWRKVVDQIWRLQGTGGLPTRRYYFHINDEVNQNSSPSLRAHLEWPTIPCLFCRETGHASVECSTWLVNFPEGPVADALDRRVHRQIFGDPTGEYYFHWDGRQETRRIMYSKSLSTKLREGLWWIRLTQEMVIWSKNSAVSCMLVIRNSSFPAPRVLMAMIPSLPCH